MYSYYKNSKKDDLADCLLQCLDYIKNKKLLNEDFIMKYVLMSKIQRYFIQ